MGDTTPSKRALSWKEWLAGAAVVLALGTWFQFHPLHPDISNRLFIIFPFGAFSLFLIWVVTNKLGRRYPKLVLPGILVVVFLGMVWVYALFPPLMNILDYFPEVKAWTDPAVDIFMLPTIPVHAAAGPVLLPGWNPSSSACCGNWTPDGKYFIFQASVKAPPIDLKTSWGIANVWALREKVGWFQRTKRGPFQLTNGPLATFFPVPGADGKRLFVNGYQPRNEFLRYDLKSGQLVPEFGGISGTQLEFSKDGKWVTYASVPDLSLWRSAVDGSQRLQLTSPPFQADMPHWSPDGKQIAFIGAREGNLARIRISVAPFDGGE